MRPFPDSLDTKLVASEQSKRFVQREGFLKHVSEKEAETLLNNIKKANQTVYKNLVIVNLNKNPAFCGVNFKRRRH